MPFFPEARVSAESFAARDAVLKNLSAVFPIIQTKYHYVPSSPAPSSEKPLTISLRPELGNRNALRPVIQIRLTEEHGLTKADLTARLALGVRVFSGYIYGFCLLMLVIAAASGNLALLALVCSAALALTLFNRIGSAVTFRHTHVDRILDILKTAVESA